MNDNKTILFFTNTEIKDEDDTPPFPPEMESKMRALANRLVDIILEDRRQQRLNFQLKNNTILIGRTRYKVKYLEPK